MSDLFAGLALLFGVVAALVLAVGVKLHAPLFACSAAFAFSAMLAFSLCAWRLGHATPAAAPSPFAVPLPRAHYKTSLHHAA